MSSTAALTDRGTLVAPPDWGTIDFISDLHLQAGQLETFAAFQRYLSTTRADALFILGDLFEVWVGDDLLDDRRDPLSGFERSCQQQLRQASRQRPIYFLHGNRDFLLGEHAAQACGLQLLDDPTCLTFDDQRWLISHGDALCTDDEPYQRFRRLVRSSDWQEAFLAKPLDERLGIAKSMRAQSEALKSSTSALIDVNAHVACHWLTQANASVLIHGHTHQPAEHVLQSEPPLRRWVLSDWDAHATPARLEVLRLRRGLGLGREPVAVPLRKIGRAHV